MSGTQRILAALSDGRWHPHQELYDLGVVLHSRISDLRKRGHNIEMRRVRARYDRRQWTWFYRLAPLNAVAVLPGEGHVVPPSATEETATATALSGARSTPGAHPTDGSRQESGRATTSSVSPLSRPSTTSATTAAAAEPATRPTLFDMPAAPVWA